MITTLNPRISAAAVLLTLAGLLYNSEFSTFSPAAFVLGIIITYPLAERTWNVIEKNWKMYRVFYSAGVHKRKMDIIRKSWKLTWWIVPYCLVVYSAFSFGILILYNDIYLLDSMVMGSIFTVFFVTYLKSPKYYRQLAQKG